MINEVCEYGGFILDYIKEQRRCSQVEIIKGVRDLFLEAGEDDPGIKTLRDSLDNLIQQGKVHTTDPDNPFNSARICSPGL